jgi:hypothetical protein
MQTYQRRWIAHRIGPLVTASWLAVIGSATAWAQIDRAPPRDPPTVVVPRYGPGVAGQIIEGPTTPVCRPNIPCTKPFANATVLVLDGTSRNSVGTAVTNARGNFIVSVPPGAYLVHVQVADLPRCPEAQATVGPGNFTVVHIDCDTGIR